MQKVMSEWSLEVTYFCLCPCIFPGFPHCAVKNIGLFICDNKLLSSPIQYGFILTSKCIITSKLGSFLLPLASLLVTPSPVAVAV